MFEGRKIIIATMHHKEKVIGPLFEKAFGLDYFVPESFDTDLLGTFTGEIERKDDPIITLRNKCLQAMELSNCDLGIASEGSFGSHPDIPFAHADDEFLIFIDKKNNLEIIERELSLNTNFNGIEVTTEKELIDFANHIKFPSHALILQKTSEDTSEVIKGITALDLLIESFHMFKEKYGHAYVITDMRALYNPTRMEVIKNVAEKLIVKIKSHCPNCKTPGYSVTNIKPGLLCENCSAPTKSILLHIKICQSCGFSEEKIYPHGIEFEDPMYCDICNP